MESKLNQLLKQWPKGTVATATWLQKNGVYRQLARQYVASGWMESLGHGAFVRNGEKADWLGGLYALQMQLGLSIHVAAATALCENRIPEAEAALREHLKRAPTDVAAIRMMASGSARAAMRP